MGKDLNAEAGEGRAQTKENIGQNHTNPTQGGNKGVSQELRLRMHEPLAETGKWLQTVVRGYFQYHAIPGNTGSLSRFRERLTRLWWQNIRRRSQERQPNWKQLHPLFNRWLPVPRILHPFPNVRFDAIYPR